MHLGGQLSVSHENVQAVADKGAGPMVAALVVKQLVSLHLHWLADKLLGKQICGSR